MARITVFHDWWGCETGCCGHSVAVDGVTVPKSFAFGHPVSNDDRDWVKMVVTNQMGAEHVADIDWDNCIISDY